MLAVLCHWLCLLCSNHFRSAYAFVRLHAATYFDMYAVGDASLHLAAFVCLLVAFALDDVHIRVVAVELDGLS